MLNRVPGNGNGSIHVSHYSSLLMQHTSSGLNMSQLGNKDSKQNLRIFSRTNDWSPKAQQIKGQKKFLLITFKHTSFNQGRDNISSKVSGCFPY